MLLGAHPEVITAGELTGTRTANPESYRCSCGEFIIHCSFWQRVMSAMRMEGIDYSPWQAGTDIRESPDPFIRKMLRPLYRGPLLEHLRDLALYCYPPWHRHLQEVQKRNAALVKSLSSLGNSKVVVDSTKVGLRLKYLLRNRDLDVRVIRLIRDGRGVALTWTDEAAFADATDPSVRGGGSGRPPIQFSPAQRKRQISQGSHVWRRSNEESECLLRTLPRSQWLEVRYEQLCANPVETIRPIFEFLGIDPQKLQLNFRSVQQHVLGNGMRLDKKSEIRLDERWRTELNSDDLSIFNQIAGPMSHRYGYSRNITV